MKHLLIAFSVFLVDNSLFKIFFAASFNKKLISKCTQNYHKAKNDDMTTYGDFFSVINSQQRVLELVQKQLWNETCSIFKGNEWFYR